MATERELRRLPEQVRGLVADLPHVQVLEGAHSPAIALGDPTVGQTLLAIQIGGEDPLLRGVELAQRFPDEPPTLQLVCGGERPAELRRLVGEFRRKTRKPPYGTEPPFAVYAPALRPAAIGGTRREGPLVHALVLPANHIVVKVSDERFRRTPAIVCPVPTDATGRWFPTTAELTYIAEVALRSFRLQEQDAVIEAQLKENREDRLLTTLRDGGGTFLLHAQLDTSNGVDIVAARWDLPMADYVDVVNAGVIGDSDKTRVSLGNHEPSIAETARRSTIIFGTTRGTSPFHEDRLRRKALTLGERFLPPESTFRTVEPTWRSRFHCIRRGKASIPEGSSSLFLPAHVVKSVADAADSPPPTGVFKRRWIGTFISALRRR